MNLATRMSAIGLSTLLLAGTAASAASAAPLTPSEDEPSASSCSFAEHLEYAFGLLPIELQDDLRAVRELEPEDRKEALLAIREAALAGDYGDAVQARAERGESLRAHLPQGAIWRHLPDDLKEAIAEVRAADTQDERLALLEQLAEDALDGDYGPRAEHFVELLQSRPAWQDCES